jgi:hypothetical protein
MQTMDATVRYQQFSSMQTDDMQTQCGLSYGGLALPHMYSTRAVTVATKVIESTIPLSAR